MKGWDESAGAWIASMGERGDWSREHVLDPAMLGRLEGRQFERALDVGCGEGRFCRMLKARAIPAVGIDPTEQLLEEARRRDPGGDYRLARAEELPFAEASFDLVVSYLTLIDIPDFRAAIREMARVLKPNGTLLIANLNSFITSSPQGWTKDGNGRRLHYPVDRYLDEFASWLEWSGIRIENWHRPLGAYIGALLDSGLRLRFFDEPLPVSGDAARQETYRRAPWFLVMEWQR
jgi:SAM-dependent methyltransferase